MPWFKRTTKGIRTSTEDKKDTPQGLWYKSPTGKIVDTEELAENFYVSPEDGYHVRVGSHIYFDLLFDEGKFKELDKKISSKDPLKFEDSKTYKDRLSAAQKKTKLSDAVRTAVGKSNGNQLVVACMDFAFIGGSMGSVVGEKIYRAADYALQKKIPLLVISKSGGARMMEAALSLMQMAKTSAKLAQLADAKIPYISLCTDPTTGGTTASFAMLGDINIAEPGALIGFAGPRVVKDTTGQDLPEGFQTSEFVLEHGFLDFITHRKDLKRSVNLYLDLVLNRPVARSIGVSHLIPTFAPSRKDLEVYIIIIYNNIGMYLTTEKKKEIFKKYGSSETNTGSTEGQIALFTHRINHLSNHLKNNHKDFNTERSLVKLVGKRRSLLDYLKNKDINKYRALIKELNIRK